MREGPIQVASRSTDKVRVIVIPILLAAWFILLGFAVALCKAAAQGDRETDSVRAPRGSAPIPDGGRDPAGSPARPTALRGLMN